MSIITLQPGETLHVVATNPDLKPTHPIMLPGMPGFGGGGPVDPGYSPPWAQVPPGGQGGGPVDPGYSPPWAQVPDKPPLPPGPVDPGYSPPWAQIPEGEDQGQWCWAYSPQQKRWMWVRVPGEGEAGPK